MKPIKLLGYSPDSDPSILGVLTNCAAMVPSIKGMKGAPEARSPGVTVFSGTCVGAAVLTKLDGTTRFFAGTGTQLKELTSTTTWTDRSRATVYAAASDVRWRFAQFGNVSLATNKNDTVQASASTAFADITGAPKAAIVETVHRFVFALNTNETTYGDSPNRWWCCAIGDYTDWVPAIATQSATGLLTASSGKIRAGKRFGENIIVYKDRSMYLGVYVGPPVIWAFAQIPGEIGAPCQEAVVNVGTPESPRHIFMGYDDFYSFDGTRPIPIGSNRVKVTVFNALMKKRAEQVLSLHDTLNSLVYFYYPTADSANPDKCVVYNYRTNQWGVDDRTVQACVEYIVPGTTYDDIGALYSTYDDLPAVTYDSSFWSAGFPVPAIFDTTNNVMTLDGTTGTSSFTTGDIGDDFRETLLTRVKNRYITAPSTAQMINYYRQNIGDSLTAGATTSEASGKVDVLREARWHRMQWSFTGNVELSATVPEFMEAGSE